MIPRFVPSGAARVSGRPLRGAVLSLIVGWLILASAGCFHWSAKPVPPDFAAEHATAAHPEQQAGLRQNAILPKDQLQEHCNQLATATPGVEEFRTNQGAIESRQWTLVGSNGSAPRWAFVRAKDGPPDGWAPKPGIAKLDFRPPLAPALTAGSSHFLVYAALKPDSFEEAEKMVSMREVFGEVRGDFTWRGRKYGYALTPALPCFPLLR